MTKAEKIGRACAAGMFRDFRDHPNYRGSKFTWRIFPGMAARMAEVNVFMYYRKTPVKAPAEAKQAALVYAQELVKTLTRAQRRKPKKP